MADIRPRKGKKGTTYQLRYVDAAGETLYKTFDKRKDAAAFLSKSGAEPAKPAELPKIETGHTIKAALDDWLDVCEKIGRNGREPVEPHTLRHYRSEANHLKALQDETDPEKPLFADMTLASINGPTMVRIRDALLKAHTRHMAKRCLTSLKSALSEAEHRGKITGAPGRGVSIVIGSRHKKQVVIPEDSDIQRLLRGAVEAEKSDDGRTAAAWPRYRLMIETLIFSGMRPSELRGLPRVNVLVKANKIKITQRADEMGTIGPPKTAAGTREINIPKRLAQRLGAWLKTLPSDPATLVFGNGNGNAESLANITNRCWWPLVRRAKLLTKTGEPRFTLYHLRHYRASTEIDMGANQLDIQQLMGHESVKTTLDIYGHLFKRAGSKRAERAQKLDDLFATDLPQGSAESDGED